MNRTDIDWATRSWNPVTGCENGCRYCYARRMANRLKGRFGYPDHDPFKPTFHIDRLYEPCKLNPFSSERIFVCSMGDLFSEGVEWPWFDAVLKVIVDTPAHKFLILTKRPDRINELIQDSKWVNDSPQLFRNTWVGVTVNNWHDVWRIDALGKAHLPATVHRFISFEPLHDLFSAEAEWRSYRLCGLMMEHKIEWLIMGAETGPDSSANKPPQRDILMLLNIAKEIGLPIFMKDNIRVYVPHEIEFLQEYPDSMMRGYISLRGRI